MRRFAALALLLSVSSMLPAAVEAQHSCEWHRGPSEYAATLDAEWAPWSGSHGYAATLKAQWRPWSGPSEYDAASIDSKEMVTDQAEVSVPEPGALWLIITGLAGVFATARRREGLVD